MFWSRRSRGHRSRDDRRVTAHRAGAGCSARASAIGATPNRSPGDLAQNRRRPQTPVRRRASRRCKHFASSTCHGDQIGAASSHRPAGVDGRDAAGAALSSTVYAVFVIQATRGLADAIRRKDFLDRPGSFATTKFSAATTWAVRPRSSETVRSSRANPADGRVLGGLGTAPPLFHDLERVEMSTGREAEEQPPCASCQPVAGCVMPLPLRRFDEEPISKFVVTSGAQQKHLNELIDREGSEIETAGRSCSSSAWPWALRSAAAGGAARASPTVHVPGLAQSAFPCSRL